MAAAAQAQVSADTANTVVIDIEYARVLYQDQTAEGPVFRFYGDVRLRQGTTTMTCDTAYLNQQSNNMEAFGNVSIVQTGGTTVSSDYLRYTGNSKQAYLRGNVSLSDGKNTLWAEELNYNLGTKIGTYEQGGTLQADQTTVSSNVGNYNVRTKDARFSGDVYVTDPQYNVTSSDLGYNTATKIVRFHGPSVVISDRSTLRTSSGTWDGQNEIAHFTDRSSVQNADQYIEADNLDYNRRSGLGVAKGNVFALDTAMKSTLYCGYAWYNEHTRKMWATIKPVMKKATESDSIYMRADTFHVAPVPKGDSTDSTWLVNQTMRPGKGVTETVSARKADTAGRDTAIQRYFIGYHHVLVYSDSLQARCDSITYSQADSTLRLMYEPIAWARASQITGDTILIYLVNNKVDRMYIPNNAFSVSRSGPEKANLFDQVQGRTLTAYFDSNEIRELVVFPNAEAIYYAQDDDGAYLGANQASSERMKVYFDSSKIERILLEQDVKQTMTPMQQVDIPSMRLGRFQWNPELRPESVAQLFLYEPEGVKPEAIPEEAAPKKAEAPKQKGKNRKKRR